MGRRRVVPLERGLPDDGDALGRRRAQLGQLALEVARLLERRRGQGAVAPPQRGDDVAQGRRDVAHRARGLGARPADGRGRGEGADDERHEPADEGVEPPRDRAALVRDERDDEDRLHAGLDDEQLPAREHDGDAHREDDDDRHLPRAVAEPEDDDVADEHADGDAHRHLDDPAQPLPVGEPEAEDGGDGGEERDRVTEHVGGDEPGDEDGDADLEDERPPVAQPPQPPLERRPRRRPSSRRARPQDEVGALRHGPDA